MNGTISWLAESTEPWTRYRCLVDLLGRTEADSEVQSARAAMLAHPQVQVLLADAATWGERPLLRHNDASHPVYKLATLADMGLRADDPGMGAIVEQVVAHQAPEGAFQTLLNVPQHFGGSGQDTWTWMLCDAPTLLYALLATGPGLDERTGRAVRHLVGAVRENGWPCQAAPEMGKFRGPGRKGDPCPIANVYALKALALLPDSDVAQPAIRAGAEMLLGHWERRGQSKHYLFGVGSDYRKLKYPFVWYDVLHVADVLSRFPFVHGDARFREMVEAITTQADEDGRFTPTSMYVAWKGWSFADKKQPSPWLTLLVLRILKRIGRPPAAT